MAVPRDIRRFESIQLVSILLGLIHLYSVSITDPLSVVIDVSIQIALTLMVSRQRKNWARWTLVALFALGIIYKSIYFKDIFTIGYPLLTAFNAFLQAIALALLFTPQSSVWLRRAPAAA
jgi:hypothetical protein